MFKHYKTISLSELLGKQQRLVGVKMALWEHTVNIEFNDPFGPKTCSELRTKQKASSKTSN